MALAFDSLAEVTIARDMLRRWWGLELGLSAADGGGYVRTSHAACESIRGKHLAACEGLVHELVGSRAVGGRGERLDDATLAHAPVSEILA